MISKLFHVDTKTLRDHCRKFQKNGNVLGNVGRPSILSDSQYADVIYFINESYMRGAPTLLKTIQAFIEEKFHLLIITNTLHQILPGTGVVHPITGIPMDLHRVEVTPDDIIQFYAELETVLDGALAHFIWNMDEMGHQEFGDAKKSCICFNRVPRENNTNSGSTIRKTNHACCRNLFGWIISKTIGYHSKEDS
jgi:hypothetical protein